MPGADVARLRALLQRAGLPVAGAPLGGARYGELMRRDKKVAEGAIRFILLRSLGEAYVTADVAETDLAAVLP